MIMSVCERESNRLRESVRREIICTRQSDIYIERKKATIKERAIERV